jgi:hypothetical protein
MKERVEDLGRNSRIGNIRWDECLGHFEITSRLILISNGV